MRMRCLAFGFGGLYREFGCVHVLVLYFLLFDENLYSSRIIAH